MKVKKFIVKDMNEAMTKIRYELGENAVILNQTKVRQPGIKGFFSKKLIKVTAAAESIEKDMKEKINNEDKVLKDSLEIIKKAVQDSNSKEISRARVKSYEKYIEENQPENQKNAQSDILIKEMNEMKNLLNNLVKKDSEGGKEDTFKLKLKELDVDEPVIERILEEIQNINIELEDEIKLKNVMQNLIKAKNVDMSGPVVFVGPTGVGKTTTIAKLAGKLSLIDNKRVGLVTIDTYRIGAVEQLKTYAEIMNIPFKVVFSINDMEEAINDMKDCDVILIDTTGRSSRNFMQLSELRAFIDKVNTENINLVISCTTKNKDLIPIIEGYKKLNFNHVIITKLDETTTYGSILNIAYYANKNISFLTTGQNVPDDIKTLDSCEICRIILGEDMVC